MIKKTGFITDEDGMKLEDVTGRFSGGGIQHMESEATIVALLNSVVSARFDQLEQMEKYEDMDDDHDHDDHEHDHQEIYSCGFQFEYNGVNAQIGRQVS